MQRHLVVRNRIERARSRVSSGRAPRLLASVLGATIATMFARASVEFFIHTHLLIGAAFVVQQLWVAVAFLVRRQPRVVSHRWADWAVAFGGTFGGLLLRPSGLDPAWGSRAGLGLQVVGLTLWALSFFALGRSFGFVAADRGLVTRGPYAVVRHPVYASYFLTQLGYVLQSVSLWNGVVLLFALSCNVARMKAEERLLAAVPGYREYRVRVRWRLMPGVW